MIDKLENARIKVKISKYKIRKAEKFSNDVIKTVFYGDSNQRNRQKIQRDHFISKVGEEAVVKVFKDLGHKVVGPDYNIYKGRKKSWDSDLVVSDYAVAVKTQNSDSASKYGTSWVFQCSPYRRDPILDNAEHYVSFVVCDLAEMICTVYPIVQIKQLIFSDPVLDYLKGKKQVVYLEDQSCLF